MAPTRRGRPVAGADLHETLTATTTSSPRQTRPRLDEDAASLLIEATRFLEAGDSALANALLADSYDELVVAAGHSIVCNARARRFLSMAVHIDLEQVA